MFSMKGFQVADIPCHLAIRFVLKVLPVAAIPFILACFVLKVLAVRWHSIPLIRFVLKVLPVAAIPFILARFVLKVLAVAGIPYHLNVSY